MGSRREPLQVPAGALAIKLSISLSDGTFETSVSVPVAAGRAEYDAALARWLRLAGEGLSLGVSNLAADLEPATPAGRSALNASKPEGGV